MKDIAGKSIGQWQKELPLLKNIMAGRQVFWCNPGYQSFETASGQIDFSPEHVAEAEARLDRFAPLIARVFPETRDAGGIIESPLKEIPRMRQCLIQETGIPISGSLLLKCDHLLPVSGSIKARGGIYEVLKVAETLAVNNGLLSIQEDFTLLDTSAFRSFFSRYAIAVGSTGNLGLSIGIMGAQLGFQVFVHMSADAALWKKELLKDKGVTVIEHQADYSSAVAAGRRQAQSDAHVHFVDDENSADLLLGYAVAAGRLKKQLEEQSRVVDEEHPLFVYLPCGVGGGPGGITLGLKMIFGDLAHCFFAEPTPSPSMLLGLMTGLHDRIRVRDFGLDNATDADGLAVGRPSGLVGKNLGKVISGVYTLADKTLYRFLRALADSESVFLEPSAAAGLAGPVGLMHTPSGLAYLQAHGLSSKMENATHLVWATGGSMVPESVMQAYYQKGTDPGLDCPFSG